MVKKSYSLLKNFKFAASGLTEVFKHEMAFKIEILAIFTLILISFFLDLNLQARILVFISAFIILILEMLNSAVERCVDLATLENNKLAKMAKDAASGAVLLSVIMNIVVWIALIYDLFR